MSAFSVENTSVPLLGVNYPWTVFRGKPNYGCDFGQNIWQRHTGVTAHEDVVRRDFQEMAAAGIRVARWFVFTDGRGGVRWRGGEIAGLTDGFFEDMDAALTIARDTGVALCLVLFDFSWMMRRVERDAAGVTLFETRPDELATPDGRARVLDRIIEPLLDRYGAAGSHAALGETIHSLDVINEPDWVTRGLSLYRGWPSGGWMRRVRRPFSQNELGAFVRAVSTRVHDRSPFLVTLGGGRVKHVGLWDRADFALDFLQVHLYPDVRYPWRDRQPIGCTWASLGVTKPVLIGEFPANGNRQHPASHRPPPLSMGDYLDLARDGGFMGAWPWSFKGIDEFGAVDCEALRGWRGTEEFSTENGA